MLRERRASGGTNGLASASPSHSLRGAASPQAFLQLHLLKEKIGDEVPQAGSLKTEFAHLRESAPRGFAIYTVSPDTSRPPTTCGARPSPAVVSPYAHSDGR